MADEQPGVIQTASQSSYVAQAAHGSSATVNVNNYLAEKPKPRFLNPQPSPNYITRSDEESRLRQALSQSSYSHPIVLHGLSGIGKTWLATKVVQQLHNQGHFPGGILWGSMENLEPPDLLEYFLGALDSTWPDRQRSPKIPLRDVFWSKLQQRPERTLIVIDDVQQERKLAKLLPSNASYPPQCCVLLVSVHRVILPGAEPKDYLVSVGDSVNSRPLPCSNNTWAMTRHTHGCTANI
jgi:hypothetical protein